MAWMFFDAFGTAEKWQGWSVNGVDAAVLSELQQDGLAHHMVGLVDRNGQDVGLETQTTLLKVSRVNVIKPGLTNGVYDYAKYTKRPVDALVPLEIIFRFGVPNGSSLMKRVGNDEYLLELGCRPNPTLEISLKSRLLSTQPSWRQPTDTFQKQKLVQLLGSPMARCIV